MREIRNNLDIASNKIEQVYDYIVANDIDGDIYSMFQTVHNVELDIRIPTSYENKRLSIQHAKRTLEKMKDCQVKRYAIEILDILESVYIAEIMIL